MEQLKQAGIEFLIPTANISGFDLKKAEPTYRIYMDRKYLQNYKGIHQKLFKQGVFAITDEELHLSDFLLFDCEFPYGIDKEEKQH